MLAARIITQGAIIGHQDHLDPHLMTLNYDILISVSEL